MVNDSFLNLHYIPYPVGVRSFVPVSTNLLWPFAAEGARGQTLANLAMTETEIPSDRIREYLRQLTPRARARLLAEMERLHLCGEDIPDTGLVLAALRAEFRKEGQTHDRVGNPSRYFLEPVLVDCE
jgi:hypothetical protein